jgi:hypothetical protein
MEEPTINNSVSINTKKSPEDRSSGTLLNIGPSEFILLAGGNREKTFNDIWHMSLTSNNEVIWNEVKNKSNQTFQPRFGCAGVTSKIEEGVVNIWLHGGQNFFENKHYADMILLKIQKNSSNIYELTSIKNYTNYPLDNKTTPRERNSHSLVIKSEQDQDENEKIKVTFYLVGGGSSEGLQNDLWQFNTENCKWNKIDLQGEEIPPREMHGAVFYSSSKTKENYLYIFGGRLYESIDDKIYRVNLSSNKTESIGKMPSPLCSFSYVGYKHFIIIYGGTDGVSFINDIIIFNIISQKWAKSKIQINSDFINNDPNLIGFLGRIGSMMALDHVTENLVIFGGSSLHKDNNYTFVVNLKELLDENNLIPC